MRSKILESIRKINNYHHDQSGKSYQRSSQYLPIVTKTSRCRKEYLDMEGYTNTLSNKDLPSESNDIPHQSNI